MKTSESQIEIVKALMVLKRDCPVIPKTKEGQAGNRKFKYAPIDAIDEIVSPMLDQLGLLVTHGTDGHSMTCRLDHISGEWRESYTPMDAQHSSDQAYGISLTYRKRYSKLLMLGLNTEDDVDGTHRSFKSSPRGGIGDDLPEDWKTYLRDMAQEITEMVGDGDVQGANDRINREKLDDTQRVWLESQMDSKTRSALKRK